ncbi:MAG TPA: phosphatase PAP2 family protein [Cytophagaceae bacterium]|jgi:membrane-associated phospholipid phosphatase
MKNILLTIITSFTIIFSSFSQQLDTTSSSTKEKKKFYQTRLFKAVIVPTALIGYGASTINGNGIYSSYDAQRDIKRLNFTRTHIDDYLQYAPYAELALLNIFQIKCKNDFINTGLLILKSELLLAAFTIPLKRLIRLERPDRRDPAQYQSFPSGHTAAAFLAASIVHKEYKDKSQWYGVGAYTLAASVGAFRMLNNRHWQSDVFAGAGFGILAVHLVYLTHKYRWGRNCEAMLIPTYDRGSLGFLMYKSF